MLRSINIADFNSDGNYNRIITATKDDSRLQKMSDNCSPKLSPLSHDQLHPVDGKQQPGQQISINANRNSRKNSRNLNVKHCTLCDSVFNRVLNRSLLCKLCQSYVCRKCTSKNEPSICKSCEKQECLVSRSCQWFCKSRGVHFASAKVSKCFTNFRDKLESGYESMIATNEMGGFGQCCETKAVISMDVGHQHSVFQNDGAGNNQHYNENNEKCSDNELAECDQEILVRVRDNIEALIEAFIATSLDQAHVNKPYNHHKYFQIVQQYQPKLSQAILELTQALFLSVQNQPFAKSNVPTAAHSRLKKLILNLIQSIGHLPSLPLSEDQNKGIIDLDDSQAYEDLLSMAIINELIKIQQNRLYLGDEANETVFPEVRESHDEDSAENQANEGEQTNCVTCNMLEEDGDYEDDDGHSKDSSRTMDTGIHSRSEEIIYQSDSQNLDDSESQKKGDLSSLLAEKNVDYKIEERIEEITTTKWDSDSEVDENETVLSSASEFDQYGLDTRFSCTGKVPFPELGMDIVDFYQHSDGVKEEGLKVNETSDQDEQVPSNFGVKMIDSTCWEENWLFQKKKKAENDYVPQYCFTNIEQALNPVCMTIPNPSHFIPPAVGSVCADDLSDLSEHNSLESVEYLSSETESSDSVESPSQRSDQPSALSCGSATLSPQPSADSSVKVSLHHPKCVSPLVAPHFVPKHLREGSSNFNGSSQPYGDTSCLASASAPQFTLVPQSASVKSDILVQFCCRVKGSKPLAVSWYLNGFHIENGDNFRCYQHFVDYILEIKSTSQETAGQYSCCVYNHHGTQWTDFHLNICQVNLGDSCDFKKGYPFHLPLNTIENRKTMSTNSKSAQSGDLSALVDDENIARAVCPGTTAEREISKWRRPSEAWPENPYTLENVEKRKHMNLFLESIPNVSDEEDSQSQQDSNCLPYISASKNLARFKRDYYIPENYKEEALNGFEEKAYCCTIYYSPEDSPSDQDCDSSQPQDTAEKSISVTNTKRKSDVKVTLERFGREILRSPVPRTAIETSTSVKSLISRFSEASNAKSSGRGSQNFQPSRSSGTLRSCTGQLSPTGVMPRVINRRYPFKVPFQIGSWPGQEISPDSMDSPSICASPIS